MTAALDIRAARVASAGEALAWLWGNAIDMPNGPARETRMRGLAAWAETLAVEEAALGRRAALVAIEGGDDPAPPKKMLP